MMRMQTAMTLMAVIIVCVELATLEMDSTALVCFQVYCSDITSVCHTDIDECAEQSDQCDEAHADCSNTVGSYECQCTVGFIGDGRHCCKLSLFYPQFPKLLVCICKLQYVLMEM